MVTMMYKAGDEYEVEGTKFTQKAFEDHEKDIAIMDGWVDHWTLIAQPKKRGRKPKVAENEEG